MKRVIFFCIQTFVTWKLKLGIMLSMIYFDLELNPLFFPIKDALSSFFFVDHESFWMPYLTYFFTTSI